MEKASGVYLINKNIIVCGMQQATTGLWFHNQEYSKLAYNSDYACIGKSIRDSLLSSRYGVTHPSQEYWETSINPLLTLAGEKSYRSLARKAVLCSIRMNNEEISLLPTRRGKGGIYSHKVESTKLLSISATDEELGQALMEAFKLCE